MRIRARTGNGRGREGGDCRARIRAGRNLAGSQTCRISPTRRRFLLFLVKPSHYDDEGYVIQWWKSALPSNSLACLFGIAQKCMEDQVLGEDVDIEIFPVDETNTRVRPDRIARQIQDNGGFGMVGFVGVQSNQFPRVMDCARPLRAAGVPVVIGGFHVSGCLSMLPETPDSLKEALDLGISLYAGEAEGRFDEVLRDAAAGTLKPIYNYLHDLPGLEGATGPYMPPERVGRTLGMISSFDAGRGCPFLCSFCTIINVQGRKSRYRTADDIEALVRVNVANGVRYFFITDDNLARNRNWESIFDRLIELRQQGIHSRFIIQVDTACHKIPRFIEKAVAAGVKRVFIGLENIDPDNLAAAKKKQNHISDYRELLLEWRKHRCITYCGYIIGFPNDTQESLVQRIQIIQRELPLDILEFSILTPLPGSEDHAKAVAKGVDIDPDLNKFDLEHVTTDHPRMTREEWQEAYRLAWRTYYTAGAHQDGDPPRRRRRPAPGHGRLSAHLVLGELPLLQHLSARDRHDPAPLPPRPQARDAAREPARLLHAPLGRAGRHLRPDPGDVRQDPLLDAQARTRSERQELYRRGAADLRRLRPSGDVPALRGGPAGGRKGQAHRGAQARPRSCRRAGRGGGEVGRGA